MLKINVPENSVNQQVEEQGQYTSPCRTPAFTPTLGSNAESTQQLVKNVLSLSQSCKPASP
jgi:hypothetical protein